MTRGRVVIIGGGVIGSSTAYHLRRNAYDGPVTVVERDPSYRRASSFLAMGGVRQQFSSRANIAMAQHSVRFYRRFDETMAVPGHTPRARFTPRGYLFLVTDETADRFEDRYARQRDLGARVERVAPEAIRRLVPDLFLDDIRFGVLGPDDGYANPREVLAGFRHAAAAAGAEYVTGDVVEIARRGDVVTGVVLDTGDRLEGPVVVNAAGAFAARIGELAGVDVPVQPVRQQLFRCRLPHRWPHRFPVVIDPTGVHWRHEDPLTEEDDDRIIVARTAMDEVPGENFTCDLDRWARDFRPPLVRRLPALADAELIEGWSGLYEMSPDHNPIIGQHPSLEGFYVANGFSGHGLMMAPAVGQAVSDLISTGVSPTVDVSAFDVTRFDRNEPFWDDALI